MAATSGQGRSFGTFIVGLTVACVGIAYFSSGIGKFTLAVGAVIFGLSLIQFLKLKPLEGQPAQIGGAGGMKALGAFIACFGWFLILGGLHVVTGTGGRIGLALVGIAVSLFGILFVLPAAFNKNAIWKA
jgi:hypothetical protein